MKIRALGGNPMDGVHDLGGMHGFGPIEREENEPLFHAPWERLVVGMRGMAGAHFWNGDEARHAIERMDPLDYLAASYYERWLCSLETLLLEKGLFTRVEFDARVASFQAGAGSSQSGKPPTEPLPLPANRPRSYRRETGTKPQFAVGDPVLTRTAHPPGHTRLPRYARGRHGVITHLHGTFVFPDTNAHGLGEQPQPLYGVRFAARELWGEAAEPHLSVNLDLWERYLSAQ